MCRRREELAGRGFTEEDEEEEEEEERRRRDLNKDPNCNWASGLDLWSRSACEEVSDPRSCSFSISTNTIRKERRGRIELVPSCSSHPELDAVKRHVHSELSLDITSTDMWLSMET
ncbi:unnamed protein product [Pleuronectes platessa]|uniref:Uncharacterized protein n=1 Tax=Pleuronectes platessa TaxID=8262 RepID=A0A9N7TS76_PLEPL|nr:unnamed protein product [Pleuronectes platessa]